MNRGAFRRFEFFETEVIAKDIAQQFSASPTCAIAESGMLIFGDEYGNIVISDRDFHSTDRRYKLFNGSVIGLSYLFDKTNNNRQFIIALGDDARPVETLDGTVANPTPIYVVKVFNTSDMNRPLYKLNATITDAHVTAFAVHHDGTEIAVGYSNGRVLLYTGFFLTENSQQRPNTTPQVILPNHFAPVSAAYFCEIGSGYGEDRKIKLFVVFETKETAGEEENKQPAIDTLIEQEDIQHAGIIVFDTSISINTGKGTVIYAPREDPKALDAKGATSLCASFMKNTSELVIARDEAIYTYTIEDRGGALAIFGDKQSIVTVGRYTLVVSVDDKVAPAAINDLNPTTPTQSNKSNKSIVTIYDLKNKFVCGTTKKYYLPNNEKILFNFSDNGGIAYLITSNYNLIRFREKDVHRKLDVLLTQVKPPMFPLAITLAGEEQLESQEIMKLYKMYGDHLYQKHEFDSAIIQYCYTIGYVPPSYVIVKFLDSYRIKNLITYLEKLKDKGLAAMDHVTLLLNCYVKIKDEAKLQKLLDYIFVNTMKLRSKEANGAITGEAEKARMASAFSTVNLNPNQYFIDPQQAILILSNNGFEEHALKVAVVYLQHSSYLKIQLGKPTPKYEEALGYLAYMAFTCDPIEVIQILQLYGKQLLTARPKQYTTLLIKLCINDLEPIITLQPSTANSVKKPPSTATTATNGAAGNGSDNSNIWSNDFITSLQYFLKTSGNNTMTSENTLVEDIIKFFYDDDLHLLYFLEGIVNASKGRILHSKIWTTYLELNMKKYHFYLLEKLKSNKQYQSSTSSTTGTTTMLTMKTKLNELENQLLQLENLLMSILDGANVTYDPAHVLLLCSMFQFERGERYLLDRQQCIDLLLMKLMEKNDIKEIFKLLRKEGTKEPELFIQVLTYLVQRTMHTHNTSSTASPSKKEEKRKGGTDDKEESAGRKISKDRSIRIDSDDDDDSDDSEEAARRKRAGRGDDHDDHDDDDVSGRDEDDEDDDGEAKWDPIIDLIEMIEKDNTLSPTQVLEILSLNPEMPLKVISNYVNNIFGDLKEQINHVTSDVKTAVVNLESISFSTNAENQLKAKAKKALARAQRKARLGYDEYDDEDEEDELEDEKAQELMESERWKSILRNQMNAAQEHETFYKELELSTDGFSTVANYIGKTIIF